MSGKINTIVKRICSNPREILAYINATELLNWMSDEAVIKLLWWVRTGKKLDLSYPLTFNEKIQWLKVNNHDPKMTDLVDKYKVREYIKNLIGEEYLIPLISVWEKAKDIDFNTLPKQFVLKCNHNAAVGLCICRNKEKLDVNDVRKKLHKGLSHNFYFSSREWAYKNVKRKIICEQYMADGFNKGLRDYKFFCFNGQAKFIYISEGLEKHETANISFYDLDGKELPFHRADYRPFEKEPNMPSNISEMIAIANTIATDINIPFVRVDLYSISGKVYFSEITFYPNSGYIPFEPKEWDEKLGKMIDLSSLTVIN